MMADLSNLEEMNFFLFRYIFLSLPYTLTNISSWNAESAEKFRNTFPRHSLENEDVIAPW